MKEEEVVCVGKQKRVVTMKKKKKKSTFKFELILPSHANRIFSFLISLFCTQSGHFENTFIKC